MWAVLGDSVVGVSHRARLIPCQDAFRYRLFGGQQEWLLIVVADGAGSATCAEVGATLACDEFVRRIEASAPESLSVRENAESLFADVRARLCSEAASLKVSPRQLACTALLAILGPASSVFAQIGDGAIVAAREGDSRVVFPPAPAEYVNVTDFLTDDHFVDRLQFESFAHPTRDVAVLTDGLQRLAIDLSTNEPYPPFFRPLFEQLRTTTDVESLMQPFRAFLDSTAVNERTDDDKTLVLAVRA